MDQYETAAEQIPKRHESSTLCHQELLLDIYRIIGKWY